MNRHGKLQGHFEGIAGREKAGGKKFPEISELRVSFALTVLG
jgi:hypothetical protein